MPTALACIVRALMLSRSRDQVRSAPGANGGVGQVGNEVRRFDSSAARARLLLPAAIELQEPTAASTLRLCSTIIARPYTLLNATIVAALVLIVAGLGAALLPRLLGDQTVVVVGGSMGHAVPVGSLAVLRSVPPHDVTPGDIILIQEETTVNAEISGAPTPSKLHRVVSVERQGQQVIVHTKGDANPTPDPLAYVLPRRVPVEVYAVPYLGYLVVLVGNGVSWWLLIVLTATVFVALSLRRVWTTSGESVQPAR